MSLADEFLFQSREQLTGRDPKALALSALLLADLQAAAGHPRFAAHDAGETRCLSFWDLHFIKEACDRFPRSPGILHLHCGWWGCDTARFRRSGHHLAFPCRGDANGAPLSASEVQRAAIERVTRADPDWIIVLTRVVNEIPDPAALIAAALASRGPEGAVVVTAMAGTDPQVFNEELRLGLLSPSLVAEWSAVPPVLAGTQADEPCTDWPQHIVAGFAYAGNLRSASHPGQLDVSSSASEPEKETKMREDIFDLRPVRTMHALDAEPWTGKQGSAYWCEWDHYGETPRSFSSIVRLLENSNWPRFIKPGSVCIDIGGHSGDTAIPMGLFCYDKATDRPGVVIVVEPNPEVLKVMNVNLAMNAHIADFRSVPCAITRTDVAEIELSDHGNAHCNGGITAAGSYSSDLQLKIEAASVNRYKARGVTLATLLAEAGIDDLSSVSFIKIDCEGYDKEILRGSADFIRGVKPVLFVEWFAWFSPADDMDFFKAIEEIGYVAFDPQTLERANVENRISDVVCIPGDNIRDWLAGRPVPASATPVSSSVSVASEEGSGTRNEKLTGLPPMSAAPRPQPFVIRWSNDMNRYRDLISLQGKRVLLIGFSEPQAVEFANREQIGSAIRLTLWADHVDTQGETFPIVIGDISRPTVFEDNQFDAVVTSAVLEHLVDMEGAFKEIKRITKHGGYFISEFGPVWSGAAGHHIYMDPGHPYLDFQQRQLPSHMHLLYSRDEIKAYYEEVGLGAQAGSVVHNIFDWDGVGRVMYEDYETLSNKYFLPLVKTFWLSQPHPDVLAELRRRHSPYTQFDVEGGFWILAVHKTGF